MKKRLLALILSAAMMTESVLPVVAADDVEVTASENAAEAVSEDAVVEEEPAAEEAEETAAEDVEEVAAEGSIEEFVVDGKIDKDKIVESLESKGAKIIDVYEENGEVVVQAEYDVVFADNETADIEVGEAEIDAAESTYYMYPANATSKTYNVGAFDVKGTNVTLTATVKYYSTIYYRARAIKPATDLNATVSQESGIYTVAKKLMPAGYTFNPEVIKWKFSPKKNKNANSDSKFIVKGTVNSKIAKQMGIKGKDLSLLKKAMKKLNKEMKYVKKKDGIDNRISFTIKPLVLNDVQGGMKLWVVTHYGWGGYRYTLSPIYCRLEASQPVDFDKKKWSKIPKKEYIGKVLNVGNKVEVTPKGKNVIGTTITFSRY